MKRCYICGSTDKLTRDHIPPKNLFLEPLPSNLITVSCCRTCNESLTLDDEAFRVFVSGYIGRSKAGEWIWQNKVMGSTFRRSPALKENVKKSLKKVGVDPLTGMLSKLKYDERGSGVFRFWRAMYAEVDPGAKPVESLWFYMFYDGIIFMVEVD